MNEDQWTRMENLIEQALDLSPDERAAFIQKECGNDEALQKKIDSLLQHDEQAFTFIQDFEENVITPSLTGLARERFDEHQRLDTFIGQYRITDILGSGGMGIVYKATDTRLNRTAALKFLPAHTMYNKGKKQRLLREARAAASLNHPNIATVYEVQEIDGQLFIVMEFIDGQSLDDMVYASGHSPLPDEKQKQNPPKLELDEDLGCPVPVCETVNIALQIAEGLKAAHQKGVIHRDLKSDNIMVTEQGQVKLLDFGLAKLRVGSKLTKEGTTMGTVQYMSPEQASGKEVDHRTDIWSLGVVLYEMLTGKHPFGGVQDQAVIYSILNNRPEPPGKIQSEIPDELNTFVLKCLKKDPNDRYQNAEELIADLRRIRTNPSDHKQDKWSNIETGELAAPVAEVKEKLSKPSNFFPKSSSFRSGTVLPGLAVGLFAFILMAYWLFPFSGSEHSSDNTIAVLPLESISQESEDVQFTDGVHEELINRLAGIGELKVIARRSVLGFPPGEREDLQSIGRQLGVSTLMDGTVRRAGERLRVSVHLIDVNTLATLWSGSFEENIEGVFEIQSRIARQVADELQASLTEEEQHRLTARPTNNSLAYKYYIRAKEYLSQSTTQAENLFMARQLLTLALKEETQFPHAWAELAQVHSGLYWFYERSPEQLDKLKEAAQRAQILGPDLPETQLALGLYRYWSDTNHEQTLSHFENALQQFPNQSMLHMMTANTHRRLGHWELLIQHLKKAYELDPLNTDIHIELVYDYWMMRDYEKADVYLERMWQLAFDESAYFRFKAQFITTAKDGTLEGYEKWWDHIRPSDPAVEEPEFWVNYNFMKRDWEELLRGLEYVERETLINGETKYYLRDFYIAMTLDAMGNRSEALDYYQQAKDHMEKLCYEQPGEARYRIALGKIYARMGEYEEGIHEGERATELVPVSQNAEIGPLYEIELAEIYAWSGRKEQAIDKLEYALSVPSQIHRNLLRMEPRWDPLRDHPRFQKLIAGTDEPYIEGL